MIRKLARFGVLTAGLFLYSSSVFAQASIAGVVRDTSQAVLPGVTVEASSPVLIEKTRTVVTDATGQYRIVDLRPGTYNVTFTLTGFSTVKREGVVLAGDASSQVNIELRVGALEETVTVAGESPLVDVQNVRTQTVMNKELLTNLPSIRNYQSLQIMTPGVTIQTNAQDVGGIRGSLAFFSAHGGHVRDSDTLVAGMSISDQQSGGGRSMYVPSVGETAEVTVTTSGGLGEARRAGTFVNMVPKDGGNLFSLNLYASGATGAMQASNLTDEIRSRGLNTPPGLRKVFDYEGVYGGPIKRDKLWFLGKTRYNGFDNYVPGMYRNLNEGDPTKWTYAPDLSTPSSSDKYWIGSSMRLTWQATPRNKFSAYYEDQLSCQNCTTDRGGASTTSPEASGINHSHPNNLGQATWTSPVTNRLLLEGGYTVHQLRWNRVEPFPDRPDTSGLIRVTEQFGLIPGISYRALGDIQTKFIGNHVWRGSASYITGAHSIKVGTDGGFWLLSQGTNTFQHIEYRFGNGVPNQLTQQAYPYEFWDRLHDFGLYAQDQWTTRHLTLGFGVRYDNFKSDFPEFTSGPSTFVPRALTFPAQDLANVHDITPRFTAAYDVAGDGRTAVKFAIGRYVIAQQAHSGAELGGAAAVGSRIAATTTRSWNDLTFPAGDPRRGNFVPDCNLLSPSTNGECGPWANQSFGQVAVETQVDPAVARGWGVRPSEWSMDLSVQREITRGISANIGYFRRWYQNHLVTINRALSQTDYSFFNLPLAADPRLPISGSVAGFFDVNSTPGACGSPTGCFGVFNNLVTAADNFGGITQNWNGVDVSVNARLRQGLEIQSGVSTGRAFKDMCEVARQQPTTLLLGYESGGVGTGQRAIPMAYCSMTQAWQTQVKVVGVYTVPRIDVQLATTLQAVPGRERSAAYAAPNAVVAPLLGRNLAGSATSTTLNLLPPQQFYDTRINLLDVRVGKILRFGKRRLQASLDMFNVLNSSSLLDANSNYSPTGTWEIPTQIPGGRLLKITAQFEL